MNEKHHFNALLAIKAKSKQKTLGTKKKILRIKGNVIKVTRCVVRNCLSGDYREIDDERK